MVSRNFSSTTATPVFFDRRKASGLQGDLLADVDELVGQSAETLVAFDPLPDRFELIGGHPLAEVLAAEPPLQDVVGTPADGLPPSGGLEELFAEVPTANAVDGPHFLEDLLATLLEWEEVRAHGRDCIITIQTHKKKRKKPQQTSNTQKSASFLSCTPRHLWPAICGL